MVCPRCKKIVPDGSPFCMNCGKMVIKDKKSQKVTVISIVAAVLVIAIIVGVAVLLSVGKRENSDFIIAHGTLDHRYSSNTRELILFDKDGEILRLNNMNTGSSVTYNADRTCATIQCGEKILYYYDGSETHKIELYSEIFSDVRLSFDGSAVVYSVLSAVPYEHGSVVDYLYSGRTDIYRFKAGDEKSELIAKEAYFCCVSPDGNTVAYRDWSSNYCCYDGAVHEFEKGIEIYAVANGGEYIYCSRDCLPPPPEKTEDDPDIIYGDVIFSEFVVFKGYDCKEEFLLESKSGYYPSAFCFNADMSEAIFPGDDGQYIWSGGDETVKITDRRVDYVPALPRDGVCYSDELRKIYGVKTFAGKFFITDSEVSADSMLSGVLSSSIYDLSSSDTAYSAIYLDKDLESTEVAELFDSPMLTDDGKTLFYMIGGSVYKACADDEEIVPQTVAEGGYKTYAAASDGKTLFLVTSNNDLYVKMGDEDEKFVVDGIDEMDITSASLYQGRYLYIYRGNLLYRTGGGYPRRIGSMRSDITGVEYFGDTLYVYTTVRDKYSSAVYVSSGGNSFKLHAEFGSGDKPIIIKPSVKET